MSKEFDLGKIVVKKEGDHPMLKLWGIVPAEGIISQLAEFEADPQEKNAILQGWGDIVEFTEVGGIVTSGGILVRGATRESVIPTKGAKIYEVGEDFATSLGYVPTEGGSVNLYSNRYKNLLGIRKGMGKFMQTTYKNVGVLDRYTVDPDAVAQQVLLNLALTRGLGRIQAA